MPETTTKDFNDVILGDKKTTMYLWLVTDTSKTQFTDFVVSANEPSSETILAAKKIQEVYLSNTLDYFVKELQSETLYTDIDCSKVGYFDAERKCFSCDTNRMSIFDCDYLVNNMRVYESLKDCQKRCPNRQLMMDYESQIREYSVKKCPANHSCYMMLAYNVTTFGKTGVVFKCKNKTATDWDCLLFCVCRFVRVYIQRQKYGGRV